MKDKKSAITLEQFEWVIFVIVLIVLFFSTQKYFGTANYSRIYRIDRICILVFLGTSLCVNHRMIKCKKVDFLVFRIVMLPCFLQFIISIFYYMINHRIALSSLIEANMQALLVCFMAIVAYNLFGKKTLKAVLIAAIVNYFVYVATCIIQYGPLALFQAGTDTKASRLLEVHEVTFVFGLLIVYFVISEYSTIKLIKKRWLFLLIVFCLLGFKRILIMAMAVGIVIYFSTQKAKKPTKIIIISSLMIVISLIWVFLSSSWDILNEISVKFGIDLAGRNWIYSNFYPYYDFSLTYAGAGIGYVQEKIYEMSSMVMASMSLNGHAIGLHNEYLRLFIELGFWPYIAYFIIIWPISIKVLYYRVGYRVSLMYFVLWTVTGICIATDNLLTYPNFMFAFWLILITVINENKQYDNIKYQIVYQTRKRRRL